MKNSDVDTTGMVAETMLNGILTIQFDHQHHNNPFSRELQYAVTESLEKAQDNDDVKAIILTGGPERSFSVGGDFNEVKKMKGGDEVDLWIDDVVNLYQACLRVTKPTVAAIDNFAIGIGFQLAITCDWRIGSDTVRFIMPELKRGIACTLGQYMLEKTLGRMLMLEIVYDCEEIPLSTALEYKLLNSSTTKDNLMHEAQKVAERLAGYPETAFRQTKGAINSTFIEGLDQVRTATKETHRASFSAGQAQSFMRTIVER